MLTLNDGRSELWQWDTGRALAVDADCSQVHFSNKVFGRSIDVDVVDGVAIIPDVLLQTDKDLNVWAFVGTAENGYTKISKTFKVNRRNKPADYVFTPAEQMTLNIIQRQIGDLSDLTTEAKDTLVAAINEAARTGGGAGSMELRVADGYVQYSRDGGSTWENLIAMADLKGDPGTAGKDGHSPVVTATKSGKTTTISVDGAAIATVEDGADGKPGTDGADGVTPHIGENGNWYIGNMDTGKPSQGDTGPQGPKGDTGATGATGEKGTDGKSAYAYAVEGGYTGTEAEFAAKLASGALIVTLTDSTDSSSDWLADKSYNDIRDAILAGIPVYVFNGEQYLSLALVTDVSLFFGTAMGVNDETGVGVFTILIKITNDDKVKNAGNYVEIPKTLPNPNALTFTGAVNGTYDGSAPVTVNIPEGGGGGETFTGQWEELVNHTVTADEATAVSITFTQANYPKINGNKTLLVEIKKPSAVSTSWFDVKAGSIEVLNAFNGSWSYWRGAATVHNGHWMQNYKSGTNANVTDLISPSYVFGTNSDKLGFRNKAYVNYTSLVISSYTKFLEEGTTIKIYGGK